MAKKQAAPKKETKKASKPKATGTWGKNYYIPGLGHVVKGDEVTEAAMAAWNKKSKSKPVLE